MKVSILLGILLVTALFIAGCSKSDAATSETSKMLEEGSSGDISENLASESPDIGSLDELPVSEDMPE